VQPTCRQAGGPAGRAIARKSPRMRVVLPSADPSTIDESAIQITLK
jgi:hypothetical protein